MIPKRQGTEKQEAGEDGKENRANGGSWGILINFMAERKTIRSKGHESKKESRGEWMKESLEASFESTTVRVRIDKCHSG